MTQYSVPTPGMTRRNGQWSARRQRRAAAYSVSALLPLLIASLSSPAHGQQYEERPVGDKGLPDQDLDRIVLLQADRAGTGHNKPIDLSGPASSRAAAVAAVPLSQIPPSESPVLSAGKAGTALRFDGIDDYALVRDFQGLPHHQVSVCGWVKVHRHKTYNRIMSHEWVNWGWNLYVDGNGVMRFGIGQDNYDFAAGKIIFRGRWHHVAGTFNGSAIQVFVDGVPGSRVFVDGKGLDSDGWLSIGGAEWDPFWGDLDELQVWDRALNSDEIFELIRRQPTGNEENLVGYWRMDEGQGGIIRDMTRNGNHAYIGRGRRSPEWVPSNAPLEVPCVSLSSSITLKLDGKCAEGSTASPFITSLPKVGSLFQQLGDGSFSEISQVPMQVIHPANQVLFKAPDSLEVNMHGQEAACVNVGFKVHNGSYVSPGEAFISVDIAADEGLCKRQTMGLSTCWQDRTRIKYVVPHKRPRVSIIVPLYNQPDVLGETIDSVIGQTFKDWELIIVNDGSTDNSHQVASAIVNRFKAEGYNMRLMLKKNGGLADARNFGIKFARAEWIFPLDSDDIVTSDFLETAFQLLDRNPDKNLAIADLKGFGRNFTWILPEYDPLDLRYTNMFHCSAVFHRSLWNAVPAGYPTTTLFGYEDWAFWVAAQQIKGIKPIYIRDFKFLYRIRDISMHQTLLKNQEYSLASVRMLYPTLYPVELLINSHDKFLHSPPEKVMLTVEEKCNKFPAVAMPRLMRGLIKEGMGFDAQHGRYWEDALQDYLDAADRATYDDWQPRWRAGLLLQRMGRYAEGNSTMLSLFKDFVDLDIAYENLHITSMQQAIRGPVYADPNMWQ